MSFSSQRYQDPYVTGQDVTEKVTLLRPRGYRGDGTTTGVLYVHGASSNSPDADVQAYDVDSSAGVPRIVAALVEAGFPVLSPSLGGDLWGNDTALALVGKAVALLQGTAVRPYQLPPVAARPGKLVVMGVSMGGACAMAWARANSAKVAALVLVVPVSDFGDMVTQNRGGYAGLINAAYSGGYSDAAYGPTHSPVQFAGQLAGIPSQVWYGTADTIVVPATVQALAAGIGASAETHPVPGDHAGAGLNVDPAAVARFARAHSA